MKTPAFLSRIRLNWDRLCMDDNARLRSNVLICTFVITLFYACMACFNVVIQRYEMVVSLLLMGVVSVFLHLVQRRSAQYRPVIAWLFGMEAMLMSAYLLYISGNEGLSYLWLYIVPCVAIMVVPLKSSLIYNGIFLLMIVCLLNTPLRRILSADYSRTFSIIYPISMLFVVVCISIAELLRSNTQRRLQDMTQKLESFAFTDPLTGAFNRRAFTSRFGELDAPAYGLSFAILDLDYFKGVNDAHGHFVGDRMLCHIVELIQQSIPAGTMLFRWGGEEFLLVFKLSQQEALTSTLEDIRRRIEHTPLVVEDTPIPITVSLGAVCAPEGSTLGQCIHLADDRLYCAKQSGRNRVVAAG